MFNPRGGKEKGGEKATPPALATPSGDYEELARRLFSCPACGSHWVVFAADGAHVVGVRACRADDPAGGEIVCEVCLTAVDGDGAIVAKASRN